MCKKEYSYVKVCPNCGSENYETTTVGYLHIDRNEVKCSCGWFGRAYQLFTKRKCDGCKES